jgi:hypothetical protein
MRSPCSLRVCFYFIFLLCPMHLFYFIFIFIHFTSTLAHALYSSSFSLTFLFHTLHLLLLHVSLLRAISYWCSHSPDTGPPSLYQLQSDVTSHKTVIFSHCHGNLKSCIQSLHLCTLAYLSGKQHVQ